MLVMTNTTRPHADDNSLTVRYACDQCGAWCTVSYKFDWVLWDENESTFDIDEVHKAEELYFVGKHEQKK